jgi:hypothetical protein
MLKLQKELDRGTLIPNPNFSLCLFVCDAIIVYQFLIWSLSGKVVIFEENFDEIELVCLIPYDALIQRMFVCSCFKQCIA